MGTYCIGCPREEEQDGRVGRRETEVTEDQGSTEGPMG